MSTYASYSSGKVFHSSFSLYVYKKDTKWYLTPSICIMAFLAEIELTCNMIFFTGK